jgi:hypothetical protein
VQLSRHDQARALGTPGVRPHRRFAGRGWIEYEVAEPDAVPRALRWLRRAYEHATRSPGDEAP